MLTARYDRTAFMETGKEIGEGIAMKFENKVAIITGSTRGIGRATARTLCKKREGAKVIDVGIKGRTGEKAV